MTKRWHLVEGKVVGVRLPDSVYAILERRAKARKPPMAMSAYIRAVIIADIKRKR